MNVTAFVFLVILSPLAGACGWMLIGKADSIIRLGARMSLFGFDFIGMKPKAMSWLATPLHKKLVGDPDTFLDRAYADPTQFPILIWALKIQGIVLLAWAAFAAALSALVIAGN